MDLATAGVIAFFVVSGFLVTRSAYQSKSTFGFVMARALRVWPALVAASAVTAIVIGPMVTSLTLREYFGSIAPWRYVLLVSTLDVGQSLPGVFPNNPLAHAVNGSLWTLQVETFLYGVTALVLAVGILRHRVLCTLLVIGAALVIVQMPEVVLPWIPRHDAPMTPRLMLAYGLGVLGYLHRKAVPLSLWVALLLVVGTIWCWETRFFSLAFYATSAYLVLYIGLLQLDSITRAMGGTDLSYGIYIYSFPVQQALVSLFHIDRPFVLAAFTFPIVSVLALASWRLIERPALRLKEFLRNIAGRHPVYMR